MTEFQATMPVKLVWQPYGSDGLEILYWRSNEIGRVCPVSPGENLWLGRAGYGKYLRGAWTTKEAAKKRVELELGIVRVS